MEDKKNQNWRLYILIIFFLLGFSTIIAKLSVIQVKDSWKYKDIAKQQTESKIELKPERGNIYDRHMNTMVSNVKCFSFGVDPQLLEDSETIINIFSNIFQRSKEYYKNKVNKNNRFVWLERMVSEDIANKIFDYKITGLIKIEEPKRVYLNNDICGQVLGCTNIDNVGLSGMELQFENVLRGREGFMVLKRDGKGRVIPSLDLPKQESTNGSNIVLTIDQIYQTIVDEELHKASLELNADAATAVMIDIKMGAILAMSNYPAIDPNNISKTESSKNRIRTISDMFEPGSTFKIVAAAALLEEKLMKPTDKTFCENGVLKLQGDNITDTHPYGTLTFTEAVQNSSNIFMAKNIKLIGEEKFFTYARNFGFGINTGIELPGEMKGELKHPVDWDHRTLYSLSYGYGLSATVLQIAAAYATIANGGILMKPYIVDRIINGDNVEFQNSPQKIRRVVSEKTAEELTNMFIQVVEKGTGVQAKVKGVTIAGKTGTASKVVGGKYSKKNYAASFVGFVPAKNPKFVLMILMDSPKKLLYGGETAAPVFREIVSRIMNFENLRDIDKNEQKDNRELLVAKIPNLTSQRTEVAENILKRLNIKYVKKGNGSKIVKQSPEPNQEINRNEKVTLYTSSDSIQTLRSNKTMPDIVGLSIREAVNRLSNAYLNISISGSGKVVKQEPIAGKRISKGDKCHIVCEPKEI
jgi:cell division protein FtsI/penicillin-binding protein 2